MQVFSRHLPRPAVSRYSADRNPGPRRRVRPAESQRTTVAHQGPSGPTRSAQGVGTRPHGRPLEACRDGAHGTGSLASRLPDPFPVNQRAPEFEDRWLWTPKEFEFESCSVPNPTVFEPREHPGGTGKADCSLFSEFEKPLGSGSHCLLEEATRGAKWLTEPVPAGSRQLATQAPFATSRPALGSQR